MARSEFANPVFLAGQIIHFEGEFDGELRMVAAGFADALDIVVELVEAHAPIVEVVAAHGE